MLKGLDNPFFQTMQTGVQDAATANNVKVEVQAATSITDTTGQADKLAALANQNYNCFIVNPISGTNLIQGIAKLAAAKKPIVNIDSPVDADAAKQANATLATYIGTDNVAAGRQAGELIKEALPQGGGIALFVGKLDARNAQERLQGIKEAIAGSKIEIIDVRTDDTDQVRAKANVSEMLVSHPDVAALDGLWSYNGPASLNADRDAGRIGQVKIIAFDEDDETLTGVKAGAIVGTVVQQPYEFGYQSITLLAKALKGDRSGIPPSHQLFIPTMVIRQNNVDDFRTRLAQLRGR